MKKDWSAYGPLALRLVIGIGFLYHGVPKLFTGQGHQMFQGMLESIGIPAPGLMSWVVAIVEVGGGLALLAGAFTAIAGSLLIVNMLVAMFMVHWPNGFSFINITGMTDAGPTFGMPGIEVNLLYIGGLLALVLGGPGPLSVDARRARPPAAAY
ncbi:MAG: DoxX family protein [Gemmatimonadales bacterium]